MVGLISDFYYITSHWSSLSLSGLTNIVTKCLIFYQADLKTSGHNLHLPVIIILISWSPRGGGLQGTADCTLSCLPRVSPLLTALLTPSTAPASPGRPGPEHSYILPQHLLRGIQRGDSTSYLNQLTHPFELVLSGCHEIFNISASASVIDPW